MSAISSSSLWSDYAVYLSRPSAGNTKSALAAQRRSNANIAIYDGEDGSDLDSEVEEGCGVSPTVDEYVGSEELADAIKHDDLERRKKRNRPRQQRKQSSGKLVDVLA